MIFLIQDNEKTIFDIEYFIDCDEQGDNEFLEIRCSPDIKNYSNFLIGLAKDEQEEFIDFSERICELRGWLWEYWFQGRHNNPKEYTKVLKALRNRIKEAKKFNLVINED